MKKTKETEEGRNYYKEEEEFEENPYVFEDKHFEGGGETETVGEGRVRILQKFTERSELLRGIENYRVSIVEANPSSFVIPMHFDAEIVLFVAEGMY